MMSVLVFEAGSHVSDDDSVTVSEWSIDEIRRVISDFHGTDDWGSERIEWADPNGPQTLGETLEIVNSNMAQVAKCGVEGGMIYIVRC